MVTLVTGATGFIGGHLARRLAAEGQAPRLLVRNPARLAPPLGEAAEIVVGDLCDRAALDRAVAGVSRVFHCAANVATWDTEESYRRANFDGVAALVAAMAAGAPAARLVHLSSVDVYGFPRQPQDETGPTGSTFGYGATKLLGEAALRAGCAAAGIPYTILRPCNVIGPGSQFIARMGAELRSGVMLTVDGGRAHAGLLYVDTLVDLMLWASGAPVAVGACYNVRDPWDVPWRDVVRDLKRAIGGRGVVVDLPFAVADAVAHGLALVHRAVAPRREPLLHPLVVRIFGRTCGHPAGRILADSGYADGIGYDEAIARSAAWFLGQSA